MECDQEVEQGDGQPTTSDLDRTEGGGVHVMSEGVVATAMPSEEGNEKGKGPQRATKKNMAASAVERGDNDVNRDEGEGSDKDKGPQRATKKNMAASAVERGDDDVESCEGEGGEEANEHVRVVAASMELDSDDVR